MSEDKLQLALNHALNDLKIARARAGLLNPGMSLDNKRPQAWCEYGFPEYIDFTGLLSLYKRSGVAHGVVDKLVSHCWSTLPWLIEGEEKDSASDATQWENSLKPVLKNGRLWMAFKEADRRRLVGRYSAMLLRVRDSKGWNAPVTEKNKLLDGVIPVWAGALKVAEWHSVADKPEYGTPKKYQYTEPLPSGQSRIVDVHPDRVFILGDMAEGAIGFLEPAYNNFVSLEKVEGGSGESFLKNASRQVVISFDKEVDLQSIASTYGITVDKLQERFNDAARAMNMGSDSMMALQGATATPLVATVPDPTPTYNINLQTIAAGVDIPAKILVGMQTGERASTEDQKYFNARCQGRRINELALEISDFFNHLMRIGVVQTKAEFTVMWDDLTESTAAEKLGNAKTLSEINQTAVSTGQPIFTDAEIREAAGYEPEASEPLPESEPEEVDDDPETEASDPAA